MTGYCANIEEKTLANEYFREVLYTGSFTQLVVMCLAPGEEIGLEVHDAIDQFFRFEKGEGKVIIDETEYKVKDDSAIIVPAGAKHNIINTSLSEKLKLYTLYSPPNHPDKTIHPTKKEALEAEEKEHQGS